MTSDYIPRPDPELCGLLGHIVATLPQYYTPLGISGVTPQVATLAQDAIVYTYLCNRQSTLTQAGQGATRERDRARYGDKVNPNVAVDLSWPIGPAIPSPILPGVERRLRDFTQWLRGLIGYEDAIGEALHLIGDEITLPDPATLQPTLKLRLNGGKVEILWGWGTAAKIAKALYIEVDRGTGPTFLVTDTNPNYTDTFALPTAPAKWKYRAIWQRDGQMLGQWTEWKEINLG